jgi:hypothetical protein
MTYVARVLTTCMCKRCLGGDIQAAARQVAWSVVHEFLASDVN